MATANLNVFICRLARGMKAETLGEQSDRQLVARFLAVRDEAAFEALLRRHGPMVYRVCWRVLQQDQDVEDAFQATFLLLAQKLPSVRKQASLSSWLHGVAHRVALKAKARAAIRGRHEGRAAACRGAACRAVPADEVTWRELPAVLDAELAELPDKWRLPLILCYLESRTQDEAAAQLGWSKTTLRRRLEEARAALGRRLARGGVGPAVLSAVLLSDCASSAALPPSLIAATVEAAACVATGQAAAVVTSAGVAALVAGVGGATVLPRINLVLALLLAAGFVAAAAGFTISQPPADPPQAQQANKLPLRPGDPNAGGKQSGPAHALAGRWRLKLPAGFQYQVRLRPLGANRVSVEGAVRFSGIYEVRQGRLIRAKAAHPADRGFEWEVRGADDLALVAQPPVAKTGSNYLGATLHRLPDGDELMPRPRNGPANARPGPDLTDRLSRAVRPAPAANGAKPPAPIEETSPDEAEAARVLARIKAEYRLKREPAYQGPVQYCLLLLGRNAQTRVWLASDGKTLYVDKNGDGDLTQPGEAIPFRPDKDGGFASLIADSFPGHAGDGPHTRLHIAVRQRDWQNNKGGYWSVRARVEGQYPMYAFAHKFAQQPGAAPVIHLGGPLRMELHDLEGGRLVRGQQAELNACVSSHYPGVEKAFVDADEWGSTDVQPVADIRLPARAPGAEPLTLRIPLTRRC